MVDAGSPRSAAILGIQQNGVRQSNQRAILTLVITEPGLSAAELSRRSKLAPQTVSAILDDLDDMGLLRRGEVLRGRRGQPATPMFIAPQGAFTIGIELGWRHVEMVLVNIGGEVLAQYHRDYAYPDARTIFSELGAVAKTFLAKLTDAGRSKLVAVGVAAPNGIARNVSLLHDDPEVIAAWQGIDIEKEIAEVTGLTVQLYNDGNAACWAELSTRSNPRPENFIYLFIGAFVGAGIVAESTLWEGPTGNSANLGSMLVLNRNGQHTPLHLIGSVYAIERRLAAAGLSAPQASPLFWPWAEWEPHLAAWIKDAGLAIAEVMLNTAAVIEVPLAIIDGVLPPEILDRLIKEVELRLSDLPSLTFDAPRIERGLLGGAAPATGGAYLPLYRRFFSRSLTHLAE